MPNHIAFDETVIQLNDECRWLYAAVDAKANKIFMYDLSDENNAARALPPRTCTEVPVTQAMILVDDARHLKATLCRLGLRFQMRRPGNRNAIERNFGEIKRRTSSFSNTFSHAEPTTAES